MSPPSGVDGLDASFFEESARAGRPSPVAAAAALGIGPGIAHATPAGSGALSGRRSQLLPSLVDGVPNRRKPPPEEKESHARRASTPASAASARRAQSAGAAGGEEDAPQGKITPLRLPILRSVFQVDARASRGGDGRAPTPADADLADSAVLVGGPDAHFESYERSLGLSTGEDAIEFFARNGNNTSVKFVYCNRADTNDAYQPYSLQVVPRKRVDADEYFTISSTGVVHVHAPSPSEFVSLAQWMHEAAMFNMLRCIRFFKHYLPAKMFRLWRANVRYRIYCVVGETKVTLADGTSRRIDEMRKGDRVLAYRRPADDDDTSNRALVTREVTAVLDQGEKACIELTFFDGRTLVCTPDHRILRCDGSWVQAQHLKAAAADQVLVGTQAAEDRTDEDIERCNAFSLDLHASLGFALDMTTSSRARTLALFRLLGHLIAAGSIDEQNQATLHLEHELDVDAVARDVQTVCDADVAPHAAGDAFDILLPTSLTTALLAIGGEKGRSLPPTVTLDTCPLPVVRAFLSGFFGGVGRSLMMPRDGAPALEGLGWDTTDETALLQQQISDLLARVGIDGEEMVWHRDSAEQTTRLELRRACASLFAERIGFAYACGKQARLDAGIVVLRAQEHAFRQRQSIAAEFASAGDHSDLGDFASRFAAAKARVGSQMALHVSVREWSPENEAAMTRGVDWNEFSARDAYGGLNATAALTTLGALSIFTREASNSEIPASSDDDSSAIPRDATGLPLFGLPLLGVRPAGVHRVYDLTVPVGCSTDREEDAEASFVANGVVVHNCKQRKALSRKLFLARESFAAPLLEVNRIMHDFDAVPISHVKPGVYQAENFVQDQVDARTVASKKFDERFERLADQIERVCKGVKDRARQYDHRIANDDLSNSRFAQHLVGGNGRIKSMVSIKKERADRLRQLKHANLEADMLGDFIRLVDYIEVEHLVTRSVGTTVQFLHLLLSSTKALFQTTVAFAPTGGNTNGLIFSPTAREIQSIIASMNENCITTVDTVDRILHHPKFKPFVSPLLTDAPKLTRIIQNDRTYNLAKTAIADKIESDFHTVEVTVSFLERHRPVYEFGQTWSLDEYCHGDREHTVDTIQRDMLQQTEWNVNIHKVRDLYDAGIFEASTKDLKNRLAPVTEVALAGMKELLLKIFHTKCLDLQELYQTRIKQLDEEPSSLPAFAAHVESFAAIKSEGHDLYERSKKVESMHRLMLEYEMQAMIPPQDEVAFDDLRSSVHAFVSQVQVTDARIEEKMPVMKQTVYKNIARLNNELEQQKSLIEDGIFVDAKANPKDVLKELERVKNTLADIKAQTVTLQGYQVLFEKSDPYHFNALPTTVSLYEKKRLFWELYQSWLDKSKKWSYADFLTLDVEEIDREVTEIAASAAQLNEDAKESAVTKKLLGLVEEFQAIMPMVKELGNKAMKTVHWRQIFTTLGASYFSQHEKIRLKNLRKMGIFAHRQLISDICEQAIGEYQQHTGPRQY